MITPLLPPPCKTEKVVNDSGELEYENFYTEGVLRVYADIKAKQACANLEAENARLREALERAALFIDEVRQDLHHERIADWYPEGAQSSAAAMSESMRVIGNRCADFEACTELENKK